MESAQESPNPSPPSNRIHDLPENLRPREKLDRGGSSSLTDAELLALFIGSGIPGKNAVEVGQELLQQFGGSLIGVSRASARELAKIDGIGPAKATKLVAAFEIGTRAARDGFKNRTVDCPEAVWDLMGQEMVALDRESLRIILLNTRYGLIKVEEVSRGSLNETVAHPREILKPAIVHSAYAYILVHNHPSGDPSPSEADRCLTRDLAEASKLIKINLLDHVILGSSSEFSEPYFSFKEMGLL